MFIYIYNSHSFLFTIHLYLSTSLLYNTHYPPIPSPHPLLSVYLPTTPTLLALLRYSIWIINKLPLSLSYSYNHHPSIYPFTLSPLLTLKSIPAPIPIPILISSYLTTFITIITNTTKNPEIQKSKDPKTPKPKEKTQNETSQSFPPPSQKSNPNPKSKERYTHPPSSLPYRNSSISPLPPFTTIQKIDYSFIYW